MMYNQASEARSETSTLAVVAATRSDGRVDAIGNQAMEEREFPLIRITENDISEANRLSLSCPICGSAVENHTDGAALVPVVCDKCGTLYHRACWERSGGKCAVLGCASDKFHVHGEDTRPVLKVRYTDLPSPSVNGASSTSARNRRLKEEQRRQVRNMTLFERFWRWLLDQIKINP
jgi:hypothetical protein